jgi:hypothetical protein
MHASPLLYRNFIGWLATRCSTAGWKPKHLKRCWQGHWRYASAHPEAPVVGRYELTSDPAEETWTRYFPTQKMTSRMRLVAGHIEERLGSARLTFNLGATEERLSMQLAKMRFFGVPCPAWMMPRIVAEERGMDDKLHFHVTADLPVIGRVASYHGYLDVHTKEPV